MMPMRTSLFPAIGSPMITPALAYPTPGDPDVRTAAPLPKSRRPDETLARGRRDLDPHRRRGDIDIDEHSGRRDAGCGNRARGNYQAQQQAPCRTFHFLLLT